MRVRRLVWFVLLAMIVMLGTGASKHRIEDRWTDPDYERKEHRKLLVIAITEDREARAIFEDRFVSHLRGKRIAGVTSRTMASDLASIDESEREQIIKSIEEQEIDGAISVRVVPLKGLDEAEWAESWKQEVRSDETLRDLIEESLPLSAQKAGKYGVEVALWDAKSGNRIWGGRTNPYTRDQMKKGAADFVQFVMYALEIEDLIKGRDPYPDNPAGVQTQEQR
jgi:hypothetical protein